MIEKAYWAMDPAKLWVIFEHKQAICSAILAADGKALGKDPHSGARERLHAALLAAKA